MLQEAASNWQASVPVSHGKRLALLLYSFLLSMYLTEIIGRWQGLIRLFCSIYMSLQSDSLPSASFDHATALGEKKWLSLQSTKQLLRALSLPGLLLHLTELGKGKQGMFYVQKDQSLTYWQK